MKEQIKQQDLEPMGVMLFIASFDRVFVFVFPYIED
jgi:hypothetical protein